MKDIWNINYNWTLNDSTWYREQRLEPYWSGVTYIPDNYFKYQKCLSGITYQYVNQLDNIYVKNAMVGKTWCLYDMYNEFDIINNFMVNMDTVDVCSVSNLDLTQRYYTIDNAYLKTKHKVILVNQTDKTQNGLYNVDSRGYLIPSSFLADSGNTFRYKAYVKLGDHKHSEWHLKDVGGIFPVLYQQSDYMSGKTYIIKHFFSYNINATNPVPKLIFTDYDIARHINPSNYSLYTGFSLPTVSVGDVITIKYHENTDYTITIDNDVTKFEYSDLIITGTTEFIEPLVGTQHPIMHSVSITFSPLSGSTINNLYDDWWWSVPQNVDVHTFMKVSNNFYNNCNINDYVMVKFSGYTNLLYYTTIQSKDNSIDNYISFKDNIPQNLLQNFFISGSTYTVTNLQFSTDSNIQSVLNDSYFSKYFYVDGSMLVSPIYNKYNHYFDYDGLEFLVNSTSYNFTTSNYYIKYKLYEQLNSINSSVFTYTYTFSHYPDTSLTSFTTGFTALNDNQIQSSEYMGRYPKGTYIKIIPTNPNDIQLFRKNTFVNLNSTYKTLVVDYVPNEYFVVETYKGDSGLTISNIDTIYTLTGISDLLYSVYKNDENDWYRQKDDDLRKSICVAYSRIIEDDPNITRYVTALLTQDDKHKFILELYNPESLYNNGNNITISYDPNLIYKPIELIEIGVDKHTKIPIPILNENLSITYDLLTGATSGSTTGSTSFDTFSFFVKSISGMTFNYTLHSLDLTKLNIDWGDGSLVETITFNGYYIGNHVYGVDSVVSIKFSGDLQFIDSLSANSDNINIANIKTIKNITSLDFGNNILTDLDINGLMYLTNLNLNNNSLTDSDKFFNLLNTYGSWNGNINTIGSGISGTNAYVTTTSLSSRNSLVSRNWTLLYNSSSSSGLPTVSTLSANGITSVSVVLNGRITSDGGSPITEIGFVGSINSNPLLPPNQSTTVPFWTPTLPLDFSFGVKPLAHHTTYYYVAYAENVNGRTYGNVESFTTLP